jgi:hypothetical protein
MRRECAAGLRPGPGRLHRGRGEVPFISSTPGDDRMFGRVRVGSRAPVMLTSSRGLPIDPDHAAAYLLHQVLQCGVRDGKVLADSS